MLIKKYSVSAVIVLLIIASIAGITSAAFPTDKPTLYVDPPEVLDLPIGSTFTISIKIFNVTGLYGFDIIIHWNPAILEYVSHEIRVPKNTYPDGVLWNPVLPVTNLADPIGGTVWIAYACMHPAPVFDGDGTFFKVTLRVIAEGSCPLNFLSHDLSDKPAMAIPHYIQEGYFSNAPPPPPPTPLKLNVVPKKIVDSLLTPCHDISVNVTAKDAKDVYSYEFKMAYNTTILDCIEITEGPFLKDVGPTSVFVNIIDEPSGILHYGVTLLSPSSANGSGVLATIKFHVTGTGETPLDLYDVIGKNPLGETLPPYEPEDGYFNNMMITKLFVDPPELIAPTMKPGDIFQITIDIEDVIDMYDYAFKLGYDTSVLTCLGAIVMPPTNDTEFTVLMSVNDTEGVLWVSVQYYPPAEPITIFENETLVTVWFMIQSYGQTLLDLYDTQVSDPLGGLMSHVVEDGFFATLIRDVAIVDVKVTSNNVVYAGRIVTINVTAMNRGNMTTETFDVTAYYDANPIGTQSITLGPWSNGTLIFYWNTSGLTPCDNFTISAYAHPVPYEINLGNNNFVDGWVMIKMLGDIDGDGDVDIYDVVATVNAYGSKPGDPNWNPDCDLAQPWDFINIFDIVTVCSMYGKSCP
jgi:hypothetical protein